MHQILAPLRRWLPRLDHRVWLLAAGRLLSQVGIGFTLFYAPIFFVGQVGLTATQVGIGIGSQSVSGLVGRFVGGSLADSPRWGRRSVLLWSALLSALADGVLVLANDFPMFVLGNLVMGLGIGLYWPATEAVVADITVSAQRNEAFAVVRLADTVGLGAGVSLGGTLISLTGAYRALFVVDGVTFLLFFAIVYWAIQETLASDATSPSFWHGWGQALRDVDLLIFAAVNVLITGYYSQVQSTLPVYVDQFSGGGSGQGLSTGSISLLFTLHVVLAAIFQLPVARLLNSIAAPLVLLLSILLWGVGFASIGAADPAGAGLVAWVGAALAVMALAVVIYTPVASSLVVQLAPETSRGVYLSVNSMCWAVGYLIGPPVGGWAVDQGAEFARSFWLMLAATVLVGAAILLILHQRLRRRNTKIEPDVSN